MPKPISGAFASAARWASAASSTVSRRLRNSLALVFGPARSRWVSSSSGKKRPVRRTIDRQAVVAAVEAAELLGGELGRAVDVARLERRETLVEPEGAAGAARLAGADCLGDHQRGGRGEDEAVDAGRARRLEQVQRAGDVDVDEGLRRIADDVGLVQRAGMDDGVDRLLLEQHARRAAARRPSR